MATMKVTYIFKAGTQGWTEAFYTDASDVVAATPQAVALADARCYMLARGSVLQAFRITDPATPGVSFFSPINPAFSSARYPRDPANNALLDRDTIQVSAVCRLNAATQRYHRIFELGSLPDGWVQFDPVGDAMIATGDLTNPFNGFLARLKDDRWLLNVISKEPGKVNARAVQGVGLAANIVTINSTAHGYAIGDVVRISKVVGSAAMKAVTKGNHQITSVTLDTFSYNIATVPTDPVTWIRNGVIRRQQPDVIPIDNGVILRINIRERGRAFFTQRGRRRPVKVV
jgi:hypothetical protein